MEALFNAARWIFHHPGLIWTMTPGYGCLRQIRTRCVLVNHQGTEQPMCRGAMPTQWPFRSNPPDLGPRILEHLTVETSQTGRSGSLAPVPCHGPSRYPALAQRLNEVSSPFFIGRYTLDAPHIVATSAALTCDTHVWLKAQR